MSKLALDYLTELLPCLTLEKDGTKIEFKETPDKKIRIQGISPLSKIIRDKIVDKYEAENIMIKAIVLYDFNIMNMGQPK